MQAPRVPWVLHAVANVLRCGHVVARRVPHVAPEAPEAGAGVPEGATVMPIAARTHSVSTSPVPHVAARVPAKGPPILGAASHYVVDVSKVP
jgi:hypothetical protein